MNILVTGGAGYIGSHVCLKLIDEGYNITVIDDLSMGHKQLIPKKAEFIKTNINNTKKIEEIFQKKSFDALFHFAGFIQVEESVKFPEKYFINNTVNSALLFEICIHNGIRNIIFSSSAAVYGNANVNLIKEESPLNPLSPYGISKLQTEKLLIKMKNKKNINYMILRYFNVAGADPDLRSGLISKKPTHLIKIASEAAVGKRDSVTIFGNNYKTPDGTAIRDYIHVSDLSKIHIKSLHYLKEKQNSIIMNCGYGKGYSVKEVLDTTNKISKKKFKIKYGNERPGDVGSMVSNVNRLKKTIQWTPEYNNLNKIIETTIKWEEKLQNEKVL